MTFGFPAYHTDSYSAGTATANVREAARQTLTALSWSLREETADGIVASTSANVRSWGEKVLITFASDDSVSVTSKCALATQCLDWGKNKANVVKFMTELKKHV